MIDMRIGMMTKFSNETRKMTYMKIDWFPFLFLESMDNDTGNKGGPIWLASLTIKKKYPSKWKNENIYYKHLVARSSPPFQEGLTPVKALRNENGRKKKNYIIDFVSKFRFSLNIWENFFIFSVQIWDGASDGEHFGAPAGETRTTQLFVGSSWVMG